METSIPRLLRHTVDKYPEFTAQMHKDSDGTFQATSFRQLYDQTRQFAVGLRRHGVKRGDRVGLISDNRQEWLVADLAILSLGAMDVPRGCDSDADEIAYILSFSECSLCVLENIGQLEKVANREKDIPSLKEVIILDPDFDPQSAPQCQFAIHPYRDILTMGENADLAPIDAEIDLGSSEDVATIIFTSGTTGKPKGAMLTHLNFLHQVQWAPERMEVLPGNRWLSILPVWHAFERVIQYVSLGCASTLCYSKPLGPILLADMQKVKPTFMASVPRIWESIRNGVYRSINQAGGVKKFMFHYFMAVSKAWTKSSNLVRGLLPRFRKRSRLLDFIVGIIPFVSLWPLKALGSILVFRKIKQKLGGRFVGAISGGGSLPGYVDDFFQAAGVLLLEGYGLTESAPVLTLRWRHHMVPGTIGPPLRKTEIKIVGEDGRVLGPNQVGILHARGPQVMKGYYKRDDLTAEMIDQHGWLNTGDLAMKTHDGEYAIVGRAKDTIVLLSGENIEPSPIEDKLKLSPYIESSMVIGQDKKYLGAIIQANLDNVRDWAEASRKVFHSDAELLGSPEVHELIAADISQIISPKRGFKPFERIARFSILPEPFELGRDLSAKQEVKRHVVCEHYADVIAELFD